MRYLCYNSVTGGANYDVKCRKHYILLTPHKKISDFRSVGV